MVQPPADLVAAAECVPLLDVPLAACSDLSLMYYVRVVHWQFSGMDVPAFAEPEYFGNVPADPFLT